MADALPPDGESESARVPGYRNYLVYCDDSGLHGSTHYAFGSLWMPWERRGDFYELIRELRHRHRMFDEFKWRKVNLGLIRFGGQFDYATNLNRAALSCSAGLA